ncbi:MAG: glycosyltransferase family protein [Chloroflexia bacterium]|nr:glycosyltransferase family protein [Chloroflexia bacterium]
MNSPPRIVTVVQARTGSSRLPNKVLLPLLGKALLARMVERVRAARLSGTVVVAATTAPQDDAIERLCRREGLLCFRGHPSDLLDRHYRAGLAFGADAVVKIPSDCPLIDPRVINRVIGAYLERPQSYDYVSNLHPPSYPDGNDVEIMSMAALRIAWQEADRELEREHTTPFLWENPRRFRLHNVRWESGLDYSMTHRWAIDYAQDYDFIRTVYEALYPLQPLFGLEDILELLEQHPNIVELNAAYAGVNWYRHHLDELNTITPDQTRAAPDESAGPGQTAWMRS